MAHDEPLPNRTCNDCGTDFYDPKARLKYCEDCNSKAGSNNGNWKGAKDTAVCKICMAKFEYYPSDKKGIYCPSCVEDSDAFLGDQYVKDAERQTKYCDECGAEMTVLKSKLDRGEGRFCSFECLCDWMALNGRADPTDYGENWKRVKKKQALDRDNYSCQNCGITADELSQNPDVHHIVPVREFEDSKEAHVIDNVVCLCRSCHRLAEVGNISVPDVSC